MWVCSSEVKEKSELKETLCVSLWSFVNVAHGELSSHNDNMLTLFCFHLAIMRHEPECKYEHVDVFVCMHNCRITYMSKRSVVCMSGQVVGVRQEVN